MNQYIYVNACWDSMLYILDARTPKCDHYFSKLYNTLKYFLSHRCAKVHLRAKLWQVFFIKRSFKFSFTFLVVSVAFFCGRATLLSTA